MLEAKKVLVLSPHTDDLEFGCGGTVSRLKRNGSEVLNVVFSTVNPSISPPEILVEECKQSMELMDIDCSVFHFTMRRLNFYRQGILENLIEIRDEFRPDVVFLPSQNDLHQDHITVSQEGIRAFKSVTTLGYELPWNNLSLHAQTFVELSDDDLDMKLSALACYKSQESKPYLQDGYVKAMARMRGGQVGKKYAEAFEVIRWIV